MFDSLKCAAGIVLLLVLLAPKTYGAGVVEETRLADLKSHFAAEADRDRVWFYSWLSVTGAVLATSTTVYVSSEEGSVWKKTQPMSMVMAGGGLLSLLLLRPKSFAASAELASLSEETAELRAKKLLIAEDWLTQAAKRQAFMTGTFAQIGTVSFLIIVSVIDAFLFSGPIIASARFAVGLAAAELRIFTQPTMSRDQALFNEPSGIGRSEQNILPVGISFGIRF